MYCCLLIIAFAASLQIVLAEEIYKKVACENSSLVITCPRGRTINLLTGYYGKKHGTYCRRAYEEFNNNTSCVKRHSFLVLKEWCNKRQTCTVLAADETFGGDPCNNTVTVYIEVTYECLQTEISTKNACQTRKLNLKCPSGYYLLITNAWYGRRSAKICVTDLHNTTNNDCDTNTAFDIMQKRCNYVEECDMIASDRIFGDDCRGIFNYLEVDYLCLDDRGKRHPANPDEVVNPEGRQLLSKIACQNSDLVVTCPRHTTIYIRAVFYGKKNKWYCHSEGYENNEKCEIPNVRPMVENKCNFRQNCTIHAASETFGQDDPCPDTWKYLEVYYYCLPYEGSLQTTIACENSEIELNCPVETTSMIIMNAWYGRRSPDICVPPGNDHSFLTYDCNAENTLAIMQSICEQSNTGGICRVAADNKVFGEPCYQTYKYLEVDYNCLSG